MRPVNVFKVGENTNYTLEPGWYAGVAQPDMGPYATEQEAWASLIEYATRQLQFVNRVATAHGVSPLLASSSDA